MKERININEKVSVMPMIPTRDLVVFPNMTVHFDVGREMSIKSMLNARDGDGLVFLCAQQDLSVEKPTKKDLYKVGTIASIQQFVKTPAGIYRCLVKGVKRAKLISFYEKEDCYEAEVRKMTTYAREKLDETELAAVMREVRSAFEEFARILPRMPQEIYSSVMGAKDARELFESIAFNVPLTFVDKQSLLEASTAGEKLVLMMTILAREIEVLSLEAQIHAQVQSQIDDSQREYYIREQIKALQNELGEGYSDGTDENEIEGYYNKIKAMEASDEIKEKLNGEVKRLSRMAGSSQEAVVIRGYLDTVLGLPWGVFTEDRADIKKAQQILDRDHYGMKKVKERIVENLAVRVLTPDIKGQIICLVGPPGVGKTSVAKSVAAALNRKFVRVSLGGVKDESDIRGHRKTYVGAMPGRIINAMKLADSSNPVMLLDEIDKMSNDFRGDPSSAMLEVLDSEQNNAFRDHYIEVPYDLSNVLFITTANSLDTVAAPLLDRMEVIELTSYTREEKFHIAKEHLVKKQLEKHGLKASMMRITNDGIYKLIDGYTREAGVRNLERTIGSLCRKAAKEIAEGMSSGEEDKVKKVTFKDSNIADYLGHEKYQPDLVNEKDAVGCVNGLAWTSVGGVLMPLEVLALDGKGKTELTGSLGDVMKESAKIAVSYCRSIADKYGIDKDFYEKKDLHIHAPEGAVPKDGPSAGVTMITGIVSALSGIKVRSDVAMTGEITLTGKVLPIGGLREKTMAAYKAGVKTVIVPAANRGDLDEIDDTVKLGLEFVFAERISDVLDTALAVSDINNIPLEILGHKTGVRAKKLTV
ncbi:MAG: endopeptidase La [Ruminococcus sp.]|nr:endopeptidase La [Ruminococcus sp.]